MGERARIDRVITVVHRTNTPNDGPDAILGMKLLKFLFERRLAIVIVFCALSCRSLA